MHPVFLLCASLLVFRRRARTCWRRSELVIDSSCAARAFCINNLFYDRMTEELLASLAVCTTIAQPLP
jgi:hypothetical protein